MLGQSRIRSPYPHVIPRWSFLLRSLFKVNFLHRRVPAAPSPPWGFQQSVLAVAKSFLFLLLCQNNPFLLLVHISKRDIQWMFGQSKISPCQPPNPFATIFKYISTKGELLLTSSDIKTERVFVSVNPSYKHSERSFNGCQLLRWRKHYTRSYTVHSFAVVMNAN